MRKCRAASNRSAARSAQEPFALFPSVNESATAARGMARSVERRRRTVRLRHSGEDHSWSADGNVDGWACDSRADAFVRETLGLTPFRTQRAPELLKLFEQRLRLFQIERVEAFAEPTVNRSE
jgi:hypothetical protein